MLIFDLSAVLFLVYAFLFMVLTVYSFRLGYAIMWVADSLRGIFLSLYACCSRRCLRCNTGLARLFRLLMLVMILRVVGLIWGVRWCLMMILDVVLLMVLFLLCLFRNRWVIWVVLFICWFVMSLVDRLFGRRLIWRRVRLSRSVGCLGRRCRL